MSYLQLLTRLPDRSLAAQRFETQVRERIKILQQDLNVTWIEPERLKVAQAQELLKMEERLLAEDKKRKIALGVYTEPVRPRHAHTHASAAIDEASLGQAWRQMPKPVSQNKERSRADVQFDLGIACILGSKGMKADFDKGLKLVKQAAEQNQPKALHTLGVLLLEGDRVPPDQKQAVELFERAAAQGYSEAEYSISLVLVNGQGTEQDPQRALEMLNRAAKQNHAASLHTLGCMYLHGEENVVDQDKNKAAECTKKAADLGHAESQCSFGLMLLNGEGVDRNIKRAADMFQMAADQKFAEAEFNLGMMYLHGQGVVQDKATAARLFQQAAAQGEGEVNESDSCHVLALYFHAMMLIEGNGVKIDIPRAEMLLKKAMDQGHDGARFELGKLYMVGHPGVPQDMLKGKHLVQESADGNPEEGREGNPKAKAYLTEHEDQKAAIERQKIRAAEEAEMLREKLARELIEGVCKRIIMILI